MAYKSVQKMELRDKYVLVRLDLNLPIKNGKIQDSSYRTLGHVKDGGRVVDGSYRTLGYIKSDGRVIDSSYRTLGYAPSSLKEDWVAVVFFFLDLE